MSVLCLTVYLSHCLSHCTSQCVVPSCEPIPGSRNPASHHRIWMITIRSLCEVSSALVNAAASVTYCLEAYSHEIEHQFVKTRLTTIWAGIRHMALLPQLLSVVTTSFYPMHLAPWAGVSVCS